MLAALDAQDRMGLGGSTRSRGTRYASRRVYVWMLSSYRYGLTHTALARAWCSRPASSRTRGLVDERNKAEISLPVCRL